MNCDTGNDQITIKQEDDFLPASTKVKCEQVGELQDVFFEGKKTLPPPIQISCSSKTYHLIFSLFHFHCVGLVEIQKVICNFTT
jgi:hypothetical protein